MGNGMRRRTEGLPTFFRHPGCESAALLEAACDGKRTDHRRRFPSMAANRGGRVHMREGSHGAAPGRAVSAKLPATTPTKKRMTAAAHRLAPAQDRLVLLRDRAIRFSVTPPTAFLRLPVWIASFTSPVPSERNAVRARPPATLPRAMRMAMSEQ